MVKHISQYICILLVSFVVCFTAPAFAAVVAEVDRSTVSENETLLLTITMTEGDKGSPDTVGLEKDFDIVSRSQSSSYRFINGQSSSEVTVQLTLFPKRTGALLIPSLVLGAAQTQPIRIEVLKAGVAGRSTQSSKGGEGIRVEMVLSQKKVFVQQQLILRIRITHRTALVQASLNAPKIEHMLLEPLGKDKQYQTLLNGQRWQVTERSYALFPQKSGQFTIDPVQLDGGVAKGQQSLFFQNIQPIRVRSNSVALEVMPIPAQWKQGEWLPAKHLTLREEWPEKTVKVGEPMTRTLSLHVDGLTASQLPVLSSEQTSLFNGAIKLYADTPELSNEGKEDGWHSLRREKIAMIPAKEGKYILPEISIPWWNTEKNRIETAYLAARVVRVIAAFVPPLEEKEDVGEVLANHAEKSRQTGWKWAAMIGFMGWGLTVCWLIFFRKERFWSKKKHDSALIQSNKKAGGRAAKKAIVKACRQGDAKACEQAFLAFCRLLRPEAPLTHLQSVAAICEGTLVKEIAVLERHLYAAKGNERSWQGMLFWQAFQRETFKKTGVLDRASLESRLPALYPK